jgi:hypothetical protein
MGYRKKEEAEKLSQAAEGSCPGDEYMNQLSQAANSEAEQG